MTGGARLLKQYLDAGQCVVCPGVYDGISARLALNAGAKVLYMTGAGTAASRTGLPDVGCATLTEMQSNAQLISGLDPNVPVIADADAGYGGTAMCARTLRMYSQSGVAALHIEDQVLTKRCGHLQGKVLVPEDEFVARIRALVLERNRIGSDILIIARSDALQIHGVKEAIQRCSAAVRAGADAIFVEGVRNEDEARQVTSFFKTNYPKVYIVANLVVNGVTPNWTVKDAASMGFHLAIFPCATMFPALVAMKKSLEHLLQNGTDVCGDHEDTSVRYFFTEMGLDKVIELDELAGSEHYTDI